MAASLIAAPVVYPWYLLSLAPFLTNDATLGLMSWTLSVLPVYLVWDLSRHGHRWFVPWWLLLAEYGIVGVAIAVTLVRAPQQKQTMGKRGRLAS